MRADSDRLISDPFHSYVLRWFSNAATQHWLDQFTTAIFLKDGAGTGVPTTRSR
jgi:hypothetical protein